MDNYSPPISIRHEWFWKTTTQHIKYEALRINSYLREILKEIIIKSGIKQLIATENDF